MKPKTAMDELRLNLARIATDNQTRTMNDQFTLSAGTWNAVKEDGTQETIESDGTRTIDVNRFAYVMAQPQQNPHKHEANTTDGNLP